MYTTVIKCVQLFCIALLFDNVSCDNLSLEASRDDVLLNREIGCIAACMDKNGTADLSSCYDECKKIDQMVTLKETYSNETIRLICRESDSLIIEIISNPMTNNTEHESQRPYNGLLYLLKLQETNSESPQRIVYIADSPIVKVENLQRNTSYDVIASIFTGNFEYRHLSPMKSFKTLETDEYIPEMIPNNTIKLSYTAGNDTSVLITTIEWTPTADMFCNYYFHLYATRDENYLTPFEQNFRKLKPNDLYHLKMDTLHFETEYILEMYGTNGKNGNIEGKKSSIEFTTPTCWQIFGYNLEKCRPLPVSNIHSTFNMIGSDIYGINVTWDLPEKLPDFYDVTLNLYSNRGITVSQNVSGTRNFVYFPEVNTTDINYDVQIVTFSKGGYTANPTMNFSLKAAHTIVERNFLMFAILCPFIALLLFSLIYVVIQNHRNRSRYRTGIFTNEIHLRKIVQLHKKDEMEIESVNVELHELLGEGAFGIVRRGILMPNNKEIAVKMLKESANIEDIKGFLSEITLMKSVGQHKNIVGIVGHSTKLYNKMMLLTEYCSKGNMLDYLRKFRDAQRNVFKSNHLDTRNIVCNKMYDINVLENEKQQMCNVPHTSNDCEVVLFVENQGYDILPSPENYIFTESYTPNIPEHKIEQMGQQHLCETYEPLTGSDLLNFAKQIATGMEFLSSNKIVHRDLAARNVLVCADKTVKIADFGLSRDIYADNIYMKSSAGRLPIKWLALESMTERKYTSQSDVWSYGILLYEIVTMGGTPYPTVPVDCLITYLQSGSRMLKPPNCKQEFYDLMFSCWHYEPEKRPTFTEISQKIDWFIQHPETNAILPVVKLETSEWSNDSIDEHTTSTTSYLKPI